MIAIVMSRKELEACYVNANYASYTGIPRHDVARKIVHIASINKIVHNLCIRMHVTVNTWYGATSKSATELKTIFACLALPSRPTTVMVSQMGGKYPSRRMLALQ